MTTAFSITPFCFFILCCFLSCAQPDKPAVGSQPEPAEKLQVIGITHQKQKPLYTSINQGLTWQPLNNGLPPDVQVTFMEKLGEEIIMATDNLGVFISEENISKWKRVGQELPSPKINALHINDGDIYVGVFNKGIFSSPDQGQSWLSLNYNLPELKVGTILKNQEQLLAGTDIGVFKWLEASRKWEKTSESVQVISFQEWDGKLIAGTNKGLLFSDDHGNKWEWIHQEGAIHYTAVLNGTIFIMYISGDLFFSKDDGRTWSQGNYQPRLGSYVYEVAQIGEDFILSNNYGIHRSIDGGYNWNLIFKNEDMIFFDFLVKDGVVYGGTRRWKEYRGK